MTIPVLVEKVEGAGYVAKSGEPFASSATGTTPEEALRKLQKSIRARCESGAQIVQLDVSKEGNPWLEMAGMLKDDPLFDEWQALIAERRREIDADPDAI
ncbi:MAG: type II toxin-antitoxin system HicB family antitoxin [Planctomycetaceae bacterium]